MSIADNVQLIRERVKDAAVRAGRDPEAVKIIAVTKYTGIEQMNEAVRAGITDIAENKVQDAVAKFPLLEGTPTKHLIGTLQTNKVKTAIIHFDLIHSVDRIELVEALAKEADKMNRQFKFLLQLNISGETTKHGFHPDALQDLLNKIRDFSNLIPMGLMTIAPLVDEPEKVRPIFHRLKQLFDDKAMQTRAQYGNDSWQYLSMGMSLDFQVAVEEGANMVRIGTAIFKQ